MAGHTDDARRRIAEGLRRRWADPEWRERQSAAIRRGWEKLTPEERQERMARVREGRRR